MADKMIKPYQFEPVLKENKNLNCGRRNIKRTEIWESDNAWRLTTGNAIIFIYHFLVKV